MANYKKNHAGEMLLLPMDFKEQIFPGSFEYALNFIIDQ